MCRWGGGGGGCKGGGEVPGLAETIFWVQLPGNNEISRFNSWASPLVKKEKNKSQFKTGLALF